MVNYSSMRMKYIKVMHEKFWKRDRALYVFDKTKVCPPRAAPPIILHKARAHTARYT
jgi:hypothetical protein